ncbi:MAG: carboxy terminal-processing peptidase [Gammaproteobacteria bacterium]|nr:carboxy terminal-processing peptidase [Gammaproteobacteria bacterium]
MKANTFQHGFTKRTAPLLLALLFASTAYSSIQTEVLKPTRQQVSTSDMVVERLEELHYRKFPLDDALSAEVFDRYLKDLDSSKSYFLKSDIEEFNRYRVQLDDALQKGNLQPGFDIFNRYQQRIAERLDFAISLVTGGMDKFDFTKLESLETDPEKSEWPASRAESDDLWRKRVKHTIINMRLNGKTDADILKTLERRYRTNLSRVLQTNSEDAFQIYMNALTQTFDPHTQYFSPKVSENFNINMSLQLEGIGAVLQSEDEYTKVVSLVPGGPADLGKTLKAADRIVGVGQDKDEIQDVVGWRLDEVVDRIRGKKGTMVRLEVIPADAKSDHETRIVPITRDTVRLEDRAAQSEVMDIDVNGHKERLGIISLPTFYADFRCRKSGDGSCRSTTYDVKKLIEKLQTQKIDGLVIDLRNNGGGSLEEVNNLLGLFIETGPTVQIRGSNGSVEVMADQDPQVLYTGPLAVVVNRLSASASEIFAGAIQDYQRGLIVGERTFGKGTVQSLQELDRGQLKITMAKFYRVSGESNQHKGIIPDIEYPSLINHEEIGESSLPHALPSDNIRPARYRKQHDIDTVLTYLRTAHDQRAAKDPEFQYVQDQVSAMDAIRQKTLVSLNWEQRQKENHDLEQQRLSIENKRRGALGEPLLKSASELKVQDEEEEDLAAEATGKDKIEVDYILKETGKILTDFITIATDQTQVAIH